VRSALPARCSGAWRTETENQDLKDKNKSKEKSKDKAARDKDKDKDKDKKSKTSKHEKRQTDEESAFDILQDKSKQTGIKHLFEPEVCPIEFVTVYSNRCEVTRHISVNIEKEGIQEVIVRNIVADVVEGTVRVSGAEGDAVILEVSYDKKMEKLDETSASNVATLNKKKQLDELNDTKNELNAQMQRIKTEEEWLEKYANEKVIIQRSDPNSKEKSQWILPLDEATKLLTFYQNELERLDTERLNLEQKLRELQEKITLLQKEIAATGGAKTLEEKKEIVVVIYAKSKKKLELQVSYVVDGASFTPTYDMRMTSDTKEEMNKNSERLQLVYYASVVNNTREDWKNVKLSISTATPTTRAQPPPLRTLYVRQQVEYAYYSKTAAIPAQTFATNVLAPSTALSAPPSGPSASSAVERSEVSPRKSPQFASASVEQGTISQTFTIERNCTIESDNKPHKVTIGVFDVEVNFHWTAIPFLNDHTYLRAKGRNTSAYYLLKGPMNVFSDGVLIATSEFPQTSPDAEFDVFLGFDPSVRVQFRPVKKTEKVGGILSGTRTEVTTHTTIIKNQKSRRIELSVFDQLPLSEDDKIKVKVLDPADLSKENKDSGDVIINDFNNVRWSIHLEPLQEKKIVFRYSIEYPSDKHLYFYTQTSSSDTIL